MTFRGERGATAGPSPGCLGLMWSHFHFDVSVTSLKELKEAVSDLSAEDLERFLRELVGRSHYKSWVTKILTYLLSGGPSGEGAAGGEGSLHKPIARPPKVLDTEGHIYATAFCGSSG